MATRRLCRKHRLRSELEAKIALASADRAGKTKSKVRGTKRDERRYYRCRWPECKGAWHLTSW